jgi:hypothetical protein
MNLTKKEIDILIELAREKKDYCEKKMIWYEKNHEIEEEEKYKWLTKEYLIIIQKLKNMKG